MTVGDEWTHQQVQYALWELASVHYEWNQLDAAESHLHHAVDLSERLRTPLQRPSMHEYLARIAWARRDLETAFAEIDEAVDHGVKIGFAHSVRRVRAIRARFWLGSNQLGLARRWADESEVNFKEPDYERQVEYLTIARLYILEGRVDAVIPLLDRVQREAEVGGRVQDLIEILVLRVLAEQARDEHERAARALDRAIELGADEGFTRTFADEGPRLIPLLRRAAHGPRRDYVNRILAAVDGSVSLLAPDQAGLISPLSEREIEVLRLVSSGESNRDIADRLFISGPTVKKHLSNILGKLAVANRTQAVDRARRLGLIE